MNLYQTIGREISFNNKIILTREKSSATCFLFILRPLLSNPVSNNNQKWNETLSRALWILCASARSLIYISTVHNLASLSPHTLKIDHNNGSEILLDLENRLRSLNRVLNNN